MKLSKKLSHAAVESAKPTKVPYRLWDSQVPQLFLRVQPSGIKSFNVQWSRTSSRSLGKWPGVTVEAAREQARQALIDTETLGAPAAVIAAVDAQTRPATLGDFVDRFFEPWALANQKQGKATIAALRACFGYLFDRPFDSLSAFDIEKFKSERLKAGIAVATVNRDLDRVRAALSRAVEWGMLESHPLKAVKRAKGDDNSRIRFLAKDEDKRLREALKAREKLRKQRRDSGNEWAMVRGKEPRPAFQGRAYTDHLMPLVLLAMNTGLRRGELFGLGWKDVDLERNTLTVAAGNAKSRKARHVPLNAEASSTLKTWKGQGTGKGLVFPNAEGKRLGNINTSWDGLMKDAEIEDFRFHDLRHDFASRLVMKGVDLNTVRELLGHADIKMTLRYAHLSPSKLRDAVATLGRA